MSALLKQKSKVGVVVKDRRKYQPYDFTKKIKANDGTAAIHPAPHQPPEEVKREIIAPKKIKQTLVEKFDQDMKQKRSDVHDLRFNKVNLLLKHFAVFIYSRPSNACRAMECICSVSPLRILLRRCVLIWCLAMAKTSSMPLYCGEYGGVQE